LDPPSGKPTERNRERLRRLLAARAGDALPAYPLSFSQRPNWAAQQADPESSALNEAVVMRLQPAIEVERFCIAMQLVIERHPMLRATFARSGTTPLQRVSTAQPLPIEVVNATGWSLGDVAAEMDEQIHMPFDLAHGPTFRARLWTGSDSGDVLLLVAHHLVIDGVAYWTVIDELFELYGGLVRDGHPLALPEIPVRYAHYVQWQRELLAGAEGRRQATYWRHQLQGVQPVVPLTTRGRQATGPTEAGASHPFEVEPSLVIKLRDLAERQKMTMYTVLLAAFQLLTHAISDADDILVSSPTNDRLSLGPRYRRLVGDCSNRVLVRSHVHGADDLNTFLQRTNVTVRAALDHHNFPISLVTQELADATGAPAGSIGDVAFNMLPVKSGLGLRRAQPEMTGAPALPELAYGDLKVGFMFPQRGTSRRTLVLEAMDDKTRVGGLFVYRRNTFESSTVEHLAQGYRRVLQAMAHDAERPVARALSVVS
jgi:hypothetical protein